MNLLRRALDLLDWTGGHSHPSILPYLRWTSADCAEQLSARIDHHAWNFPGSWHYISETSCTDPEGFLPLIQDFDFRNMPFGNEGWQFLKFVNWLFESQQVSSSNFRAKFPYRHSPHLYQEKHPPQQFLRTEPTNDLDQTLLASIPDVVIQPAPFPLASRDVSGSFPLFILVSNYCQVSSSVWGYFFLGRGQKSCLFFTDPHCSKLGRSRLSRKAQPGGHHTVDDCIIHGPECISDLLG